MDIQKRRKELLDELSFLIGITMSFKFVPDRNYVLGGQCWEHDEVGTAPKFEK